MNEWMNHFRLLELQKVQWINKVVLFPLFISELSQKVWRNKLAVDKVTLFFCRCCINELLRPVQSWLLPPHNEIWSSWSNFNDFDSQDWNAAVAPLLIMIKLTILSRGHSHWRLYMWTCSHNAIVTKVCKVIIRFGSKLLAVGSSFWECDKLWKDLAAGSVSWRWELNVWDGNSVLPLASTLRFTLPLSLSLFVSLSLSMSDLFSSLCLHLDDCFFPSLSTVFIRLTEWERWPVSGGL